MEKEQLENDFFSSLLIGDRRLCRNIMKEFRTSNFSIVTLYEELFMKNLYKLGQMWEYNKITISVEHMATAIIEGLMNELCPEVMSFERINKKVVVSCVENEQHQVGGKMVADIFEKNCWDAHYLGANTPIDELVTFCDLVKPDLICLSVTSYSNIPILLEEIKGIREVTNIPIITGGQALKRVGVELCGKLENVFYHANLEAVENYIKGCA